MQDSHQKLVHLHRQHGRALHGLLYRLTADANESSDLLQELFLHLTRAPGFASAVDPVAYAFRAAMRLASNHRRARGRRPVLAPLLAELPGTGPPPFHRVIQAELRDRLLASIPQLPTRIREAFTLRYLAERPYDEIGRMLQTSSHDARGMVHRAVRALRDILDNND